MAYRTILQSPALFKNTYRKYLNLSQKHRLHRVKAVSAKERRIKMSTDSY